MFGTGYRKDMKTDLGLEVQMELARQRNRKADI